MSAIAEPAAEAARACPQCGGGRFRDLPAYSREPWRVGRCRGCGFVFLQNAPDYDLLVDELAWEKSYQAEKKRRKKQAPVLMAVDQATRWRLGLFKGDAGRLYRRMFRPGRVLDVGCGPGTAIPEPFTPFGVEISQMLHAEADTRMRDRGGYAVHAPAVEGVARFPDAYFTGVILSSILEHEKAPQRLLEEVRRVLVPGGAAYLKVPNFACANRQVMGGRWCGFRHPDHVNYFTPASLKLMAEKTGLQFRHSNPMSPFDDNIHAVLRRPA